jgi:hypothetical protein
VHISAVEKAGLSDLREGAKMSFDVVANRGKERARKICGSYRPKLVTAGIGKAAYRGGA